MQATSIGRRRGGCRRSELGAAGEGGSSITVDVDDGLGKCVGSLLRHVVADAGQNAMRIPSRELLGVGRTVQGRAVEIGGNRNRWNRDDRPVIEFFLQLVVLRLARSQAESPPVVVNYDADMVRIVESSRAALEGRVVEVPL